MFTQDGAWTDLTLIHRFFSFGPGKKKGSTPVPQNNVSLSQTPQPLKRHGSDDQAVAMAGIAPHGSTGSVGDGGSGVHKGGASGLSNKLDCDPPYRWVVTVQGSLLVLNSQEPSLFYIVSNRLYSVFTIMFMTTISIITTMFGRSLILMNH